MRPASPRLILHVQHAAAATGFPPRVRLRRWTLAALERDAVVTLRFVGAGEGRRLNAAFRNKPHPTNVLTFVYDEAARLSGDIVLCVPVLRREAREQAKTLDHHCAHLVVHGMLHLQGYDHQREREARRMETQETAILAGLGIPDPYTVT
ncbi:MAG: rRNA maturation RNase YbeY [Casimicrobiaceae bacterium]